jgi:minor histocompatibility antigen H13
LRYFDKNTINFIFSIYFILTGVLALTKTLVQLTYFFTKFKPVPFRISLTQRTKGKNYKILNLLIINIVGLVITSAKFSLVEIGCLLCSVLVSSYYLYSKNWLISNLFGISYSLSALSLIKLDSFQTAFILLFGLFIYDIFWVFGTDVMVTVATKFEVPVKLLWPRTFFPQTGQGLQFSLLGLGDIVVPGVVICLCLQFDRYMALKRIDQKSAKQYALKPSTHSFKRTYFFSCYIAYIVGLALTMAVMHIFKAGQPALLYLSPACSLAPIITACIRGELKDFLEYQSCESECRLLGYDRPPPKQKEKKFSDSEVVNVNRKAK